VTLDVRLDKDRAAVGEPITMTVTARHEQALDWERRSVSDKAGTFDIDQVFGPAPPPPDPNAPGPSAPSDANAPGPRVTRVLRAGPATYHTGGCWGYGGRVHDEPLDPFRDDPVDPSTDLEEPDEPIEPLSDDERSDVEDRVGESGEDARGFGHDAPEGRPARKKPRRDGRSAPGQHNFATKPGRDRDEHQTDGPGTDDQHPLAGSELQILHALDDTGEGFGQGRVNECHSRFKFQQIPGNHTCRHHDRFRVSAVKE
jgi:hypothetical protein